MADETQVINSSLALLGDQRITSLGDGSELANLTSLRFSIARDAILELNPWNFASYRKTLARSTITPANSWAYQYQLPTQPYCIKVRDVNPDSTSPPVQWEIGADETDGRVIWSDDATVSIRYTGRQTNLNVWSPLAVVALTYFLAGDLAIAITKQKSKGDAYRGLLSAILKEAIISDAREGSPVVVPAPTTLVGIR